MSILPLARPPLDYPESDGKPMAENTVQFDWIVFLYDNLATHFEDRPDVFVKGNQNWYPVEGNPDLVVAPDVYVVFGRPKGDRASWKQWEEDDTPLTVVFEVLSPKNTDPEMDQKLLFYEDYGVEEYYLFDPDTNALAVYLRKDLAFKRVLPLPAQGFVSPRLGVRFDLTGDELVVRYPDGRAFVTLSEETVAKLEARQEAATARQAAETAGQAAESASQEAETAKQEAETARQEATRSGERAARIAELSRKARRQQATPEELAELERLEDDLAP